MGQWSIASTTEITAGKKPVGYTWMNGTIRAVFFLLNGVWEGFVCFSYFLFNLLEEGVQFLKR